MLSKAIADRIGYYCTCYECGKSTDEFSSPNEAEEAWNRGEASDLKDTALRGMYAIVMTPFKTWWQVFIRFFFLLLGPVTAYMLMATLEVNLTNMVLFIGMGIGGAMWVGLALYFFVLFIRRHHRSVRRLPQKERPKNISATVFAYLNVLCVYIYLIIFIITPFIEACRSGKAFLN